MVCTIHLFLLPECILMLMTSAIEIKACLLSTKCNLNMDISIIDFIKYIFSKFYHRHAELIVKQNTLCVKTLQHLLI